MMQYAFLLLDWWTRCRDRFLYLHL